MKIKNIKLKWYAIRYDMNTDKIEYFNVLSETITENIIKNIKNKKITTLKKLKSFIDNEFTYYYWCRSEYEIAVSNLFEEDLEKAEKVDIYSQLKPNLDIITEYINYKMELNLE